MDSKPKNSNMWGIFGFSTAIASAVAFLFVFFAVELLWLQLIILGIAAAAIAISAVGLTHATKKDMGFYGCSMAGVITAVVTLLVGIVALLAINYGDADNRIDSDELWDNHDDTWELID